jgi:hypothetical protein
MKKNRQCPLCGGEMRSYREWHRAECIGFDKQIAKDKMDHPEWFIKLEPSDDDFTDRDIVAMHDPDNDERMFD